MINFCEVCCFSGNARLTKIKIRKKKFEFLIDENSLSMQYKKRKSLTKNAND